MNTQRAPGTGSLLFVLLAGVFFTLLNTSIVNVMLPKLMDEFAISAPTAQWLSTGFLLTSGIVFMLVPYLSKRHQYKTLFSSAMVFLVAGSLICAAAPSFPVMFAGRLVQAVGYGLVLPLAMILVLAITPAEKRGVNMGILGIGMMLAPAFGPTLAGVSLSTIGWRALFVILSVGGAAVLGLTLVTFRYRNEQQPAQLDGAGVILSAMGLSSLLYGISSAGDKGWAHTDVIVPIAAGIGLLVGFAVVELRKTTALLDLRVFKDRGFASSVIVTMALQMAFYGGLILMPIYFEMVMGYSGLRTGLLLLPGSVLIGAVGVVSGKLYDKIGIKPLAITGTLVMAATAVFLARITPETSAVQACLTYTVFALGVAIVMTPLSTAAFATVPPKQNSDAVTLQNTLRQIAGSIGMAVLITAMSTSAHRYATNLGGAVTPQTPLLAANHGITTAFILTVVLCLFATVLSLFLASGKKDVSPQTEVSPVLETSGVK